MKGKAYDMFGIVADDLEAAREIVERLLSVRLVAHESGYRGGEYYRLSDVGREHLILQRNYDDFEREWTEPSQKDKPFLLYVNETERSREVQEALTVDDRVSLIKHQVV